MKAITLKIMASQMEKIRADLCRSHKFASERVGFITCRFGTPASGCLLILAEQYHAVADEDYIKDFGYGALIGTDAFRKIFQFALSHEVGIFHVHLHDHNGRPKFSKTDNREMAKYVPDFFHVRPKLPHGALVLSKDSANGRCWFKEVAGPKEITDFVVVGTPLRRIKEVR